MKLLPKRRGHGAFSITCSWRRLCLSPDLFTLNLQTTMLHRADAGGDLEADLDTLRTEEITLLQQKKRGLRKPEPKTHLLHPERRTWARDYSNESHSQTLLCPYSLGSQRFISSNQPPPQPWARLVTLPCLKIKTALPRCLLRLCASQTPKLCFSPSS